MSSPQENRPRNDVMRSVYLCPKTRQPLYEDENGLSREDGIHYRLIRGWNNTPIPDFLSAYELGDAGKKSLDLYDKPVSLEMYRNFLNWLFQTFNESEPVFRRN